MFERGNVSLQRYCREIILDHVQGCDKCKISVYVRQCMPTQKRWGIKHSRKGRYQLYAMAWVLTGPKSYRACLWWSLQLCFTNNSPSSNHARAENCLERGLEQYLPNEHFDSLIGSSNNRCKMCISVRRNYTSYSSTHICYILARMTIFHGSLEMLQEISFLFFIFLFFDAAISVPFYMIIHAHGLY